MQGKSCEKFCKIFSIVLYGLMQCPYSCSLPELSLCGRQGALSVILTDNAPKNILPFMLKSVITSVN